MKAKVKCPACGGDLVRVLAPGSYVCARSVVDAVVPPSASGTGHPEAIYRRCGFEFSGPELSIEEFCDCGLAGPSAPCVACERRCCSRCGDSFDGAPHCASCAAARETEAKRAARSKREAFEREWHRVEEGITRVEGSVRESLGVERGEDLVGEPLVAWLRKLECDLDETLSVPAVVRYVGEKRSWIGITSRVERIEREVKTWCMYAGERGSGPYTEGPRGPEYGILVPEGLFAMSGARPGDSLTVYESTSSRRPRLQGMQADEAIRDIARAIFVRQPLGRGPARFA